MTSTPIGWLVCFQVCLRESWGDSFFRAQTIIQGWEQPLRLSLPVMWGRTLGNRLTSQTGQPASSLWAEPPVPQAPGQVPGQAPTAPRGFPVGCESRCWGALPATRPPLSVAIHFRLDRHFSS